jgi:hypothetical protein
VFCSIAETPESVRPLENASPLGTISVPPKPASRSVNRKQTLRGSVENPVYDPVYTRNVSMVSTSMEAPKIVGDEKNVGISKRRKMRSIYKKEYLALHVSVTERKCNRFQN